MGTQLRDHPSLSEAGGPQFMCQWMRMKLKCVIYDFSWVYINFKITRN